MATTVCKFSKMFRGSKPPYSLRVFFILHMLQNSSAKNVRLKIYRNWVPLPEKISEYAPDMKTFF